MRVTNKQMKKKGWEKRPNLLSHWDGYCVVRGPPEDLYDKWYMMVYYAMCAGQCECRLMILSFGTLKSDSLVTGYTTSGVQTLELNNALKFKVDAWCESQGITYQVKKPADSDGKQLTECDFAYLVATWDLPRGYKCEPQDPFKEDENDFEN